jgi:hypothetical protein
MATNERPQHGRMSAAAIVVGLVSLPTAFLPFGIVVALAALVLGIAARSDAISNGRPVRMAHGALVLGAVSVLIWVLVVAGFALLAGVTD